MADKPIPFSAPMVAALRSGAKTQTRRVLSSWDPVEQFLGLTPFVPGQRLYVRESYYQGGHWEPMPNLLTKGGKQKWQFVADDDRIHFLPQGSFRKAMPSNPAERAETWLYKRLGRFMPRSASRMTLIVTDVRVERLNNCSEADALAEGVVPHPNGGFWVPGVDHPNKDFPYLSRATAREMYAALWDVINGSGAWLGNPFVVAVSFTVHDCNIDHMEAI